MARITKVRLLSRGVQQLLKAPEMDGELARRARAIASAAGPGHEVQVWVGRRRVRATVRTQTPEAMRREAKHRTLTSAIDAGRR